MTHYLIAEFAGELVAFDTARIETIVRIGAVVKVPRVSPLIAGICALRSKVLTLIDCQHAVTGVPAKVQTGDLAINVTIGSQHYGLIVDRVSDIVEIENSTLLSLPVHSHQWGSICRAYVEINGQPVLIINPDCFIKPENLAIAA